MTDNGDDFLDQLARQLISTPGSRQMPWPGPGQPHGFRSFANLDEWKRYLSALCPAASVPLIVSLKFARAQKLYLLAWLDLDLVKAGELVALTALELAVTDRYFQKIAAAIPPEPLKPGKIAKPPSISFARMLDFMVTGDGLTDEHLPVVRQYGGSVVARLRWNSPVGPSIAELRNNSAHGYPFDGFPQCGLIEVVSDLIAYAYREEHSADDRDPRQPQHLEQ